MIDQNDWRLTTGPVSGREEALRGATLHWIPFKPLSERWDHEHCVFCWAKFYLHEGCLREGWCTEPENGPDADWICPECAEDFREMFGFTMLRDE